MTVTDYDQAVFILGKWLTNRATMRELAAAADYAARISADLGGTDTPDEVLSVMYARAEAILAGVVN